MVKGDGMANKTHHISAGRKGGYAAAAKMTEEELTNRARNAGLHSGKNMTAEARKARASNAGRARRDRAKKEPQRPD